MSARREREAAGANSLATLPPRAFVPDNAAMAKAATKAKAGAKAKPAKVKAKVVAKAKPVAKKPAAKPKSKPAAKPKPAAKTKPKPKPATKAKAKSPPKAKPTAKEVPKRKADPNATTEPAPKGRGAPRSKRASAKSVAGGASSIESHPSYAQLASTLTPGRHAGGLILATPFGALDEEMGAWLMGNTAGRRSLGRGAFGEILVFRDLRARAADLGLPSAAIACDVVSIDIHHKKMTMLGDSVATFLEGLDDPAFRRAFLREELYEAAKSRIGDYGDDECFFFVPGLALGGSEVASSVERGDWRVHQAILLQT